MKAFLVGLLFLFFVTAFVTVGFFFTSLLLFLGFIFLRVALFLFIVCFFIWLLGKVIIFAWDELHKPRRP